MKKDPFIGHKAKRATGHTRGSLSAFEEVRNAKFARCRIVVEHTLAHLKKWQILAACYRGHLNNDG